MKRDRHSISWLWPIFFLIGGCVLFYLIHLLDHLLPTPVSLNEAIENPKLFSGERSRTSLRKLTALGPRVVGDIANEVHAPKIIEDEVIEAMSEAHSSQRMYLERQNGSGAYFLEFKPGFINMYYDVQNVLVMLEGSEGLHNIVVNCHYDTVPSSDGAADDALTCAIMLELIRVLSKSAKPFKHNVVFLFNGAEETPLEGSHLFLKHKWANNSRVILNLEAGGTGGRALLFQSGPKNSWLFNRYWRHSPHLHGQVWLEEVFQNGMMPSDTDFRIFRDFGNMIGLDFGFCRNGYVYHTRYDREEYIPAGSHQYLGENILELLRGLGDAEEFYDMPKYADGEIVYYDYIGWFMIAYSVEAGIAINIIFVILSIMSIILFFGRLSDWSWLPGDCGLFEEKPEQIDSNNIESKTEENDSNIDSTSKLDKEISNILHHAKMTTWEILKELNIAFGARLLATIAAIAVTAIISVIVNATAELVMPWYSSVWLLFPFYWCPTLIFYALIPRLVDIWRQKNVKRRGSLAMTTQMNLIVAQIPWTILLFGLTCAGVRSSCLFLLPVASSAIANIILHLSPLYKTVHKWIWVYLFIHIPSLVFTMYITLLVYAILIPVAGRSGVINSDLYLGIVTALATFYITSFIIPLMSLVRKEVVIHVFLALFSIIMIIIALTTPVGLPYRKGLDDPSPQRYWIMHSEREFYNQSGVLRGRETGYFILNLDPNSPRTIPLNTRTIRSLEPDCENELYCGLPFYMTRMIPLSSASSWIPASPPIQPNPIKFKIEKHYSSNMCELDISFNGPDKMTLTFSPRDGADLIEWDIPTAIKTTGVWKGRPFYYLHITRGDITVGDVKLKMKFNVTPNQINGEPFMDIAIAANHAHHDQYRTKEFQEFLDSFPDWTMIFGWISAIKLYTI